MSENTSRITIKLEDKWLNVLRKELNYRFSNVNIQSHDYSHHFRVWLYAKQILVELSKHSVNFSENEIEILLISIFFHDIGMTVDSGTLHGEISAAICKEFFISNSTLKVQDLDSICNIIKNHDDKEYLKKERNAINITTILSICDDLDAFGIIGIYRYAEIYLLREVSITELPKLILINSKNRYRNFLETFKSFKTIVNNQKERYILLQEFYSNLQEEINDSNYKHTRFRVEIIKLIENTIIQKSESLEYLFENSKQLSKNTFVQEFFKLLHEDFIS